jgi:DNA ligase-1
MESFIVREKKTKKILPKAESTVVEETIPTFPKLYQLNNNNKIYEWSIRIETSSGDSYDIITAHGEKDGNMVSHVSNIDKGKVKRTVLQQAVQEAERKWKNKKEKDLYCETVEETTSNSESSTMVIRPMLANTFSFDAYKKGGRGFRISLPAFVQKKYDGIRCIAYLKDGEIVMESRKGIPFQNFVSLRNQLKALYQHLPETFYFDGELYTDRVDFETLSGLVRLSEKKASSADRVKIEEVQYHVYDFAQTDQLDMTYQKRFEFLETFLTTHESLAPLVQKVDTEVVHTLEQIKEKHDTYVQRGYEGIMIREMSGPYEVQKRSKYLQKYKEFFEEEFKIVGFHEGTGDMKGCVIWDCENKDGKVFAVVPKGTFETKRQFFLDGPKYINKLLTVIFQEYTADGVPRFPIGKGIRDIF